MLLLLLSSAGAGAPWLPWHGWRPDAGPAVAIAVTAAVYAAGVRAAWRRAGHGRGIRVAQVWFFVTGMAVLALALVSPLDALADDLFAAHMAQHVLLAVVAPPFLVAGAPMLGLLWALPAPARRTLVARLRAMRGLQRVWRTLTLPIVAWTIHLIAIWSWHEPRLYELALENDNIHALEHLSFVGTAALLWWTILHPHGARRTAYGVGILTLFATAMHTGVLGALLTLSRRVWYPLQTATSSAWGLTPLEDQQLAGLIMWVVGGLLYIVAMSVLFVAWLEPAPEPTPMHPRIPRPSPAPAAGDAGAAPRGTGISVATTAVVALLLAVATLNGCSRAEASSVPGGSVERGKQDIAAFGCGACHTIAGISGAHGLVGPPLTGVASRSLLAGELPNTPDNMERWIENPQAINPHTAMPNLGVAPQSARDIVAYLYTLR